MAAVALLSRGCDPREDVFSLRGCEESNATELPLLLLLAVTECPAERGLPVAGARAPSQATVWFQDRTAWDTALVPGNDDERRCCNSVDCIRVIKSARFKNSVRRRRLYSMYRKASMLPSWSMHCIRFDGLRWNRWCGFWCDCCCCCCCRGCNLPNVFIAFKAAIWDE